MPAKNGIFTLCSDICLPCFGTDPSSSVKKKENFDENGLFIDDPEEFDKFTTYKVMTEKGEKIYQVQWKRPFEITGKEIQPIFINNGADRFDIFQGTLGDCWFLATLQLVMENEKLEDIILCKEFNSFEQGKYTGKFKFRFWQYGKWEETVIDDKLPVVNIEGIEGKPPNGLLVLLKKNLGSHMKSCSETKAYSIPPNQVAAHALKN